MNSFVISSICAFISALFISMFAFLKGHKSPIRNAFIPIAFLAGLWCLFPAAASVSSSPTTTLFLVRLVYISALFTGPAFLTFGITMAEAENKKFERKLIFLSYAIGILFLPLLFLPLFIKGVLTYKPYFALVVGPIYPIFIAFFASTCLYSFYRLATAFKTAIGQRKNQIKYIFIAYLFAFLSAVVHFGSAYGLKEVFPHDILVIVCMTLLAYAVIAYRLMDIRIAIARTVILVIIYSIILFVPIILTTGFKQHLIKIAGDKWWLIPIIIYTITITLAPFVYQKLQRRAEGRILKDERHNHMSLMSAAQTITLMRDFHKLLNMIVRVLTKTLGIKYASIYLRDRDRSQYTFCVTRGGNKDCASVDSGNSLIKYLQGVRKPIILEELKREYSDRRDVFIKEMIDTLNKLDADILVPSFIEDALIGFLVLGNKRSGDVYTTEDLNVLSNLANQSALAIENAQFLKEREEMQGKLREAETLTTIRDLLGSFNHELYNLLTPVSGTLQGITMGDYDKKPEKLKSDAQKSVGIMFFIKTYLGWVREYVESGDKIAAYQLSELINGGISYSKDKIEKQNIKTHIDVNPKIFVVGYESLPLLFKHLTIHSIYGYGMENGGTIDISARILEDASTVEIIQTDTGEDLTRYIKEGSTMGGTKFAEKGKIGGASYFIAQAVVSKHKGLFEVEPTGGKGTRFKIRLPLDFNKVST